MALQIPTISVDHTNESLNEKTIQSIKEILLGHNATRVRSDNDEPSSSPESTHSPIPRPTSLSPTSSPLPKSSPEVSFSTITSFQNLLRDGIQEIEKVKIDWQKKQHEKDNEIDYLKGKLSKATREIEACQDTYHTIVNQKRFLQQENDQLRSELEVVSKTSSEKDSQLKTLQTALARAREEIENWKKEANTRSTAPANDKQIEVLNSTIALLTGELEQVKGRCENLQAQLEQQTQQQMQSQAPAYAVSVNGQPQLVVYNEQMRDGEVKILRSRLEAERKEIELLKQQITFNKKREEDIRKEAQREVEKMKTAMAFKDQEIKTLQQEYQKLVNPTAATTDQNQNPSTPPPPADINVPTEEEFIRTVDQSSTPKKRRLVSPKKKASKKKKIIEDDEDYVPDRSPNDTSADNSMQVDHGMDLHTSVMKTATGGVRIMIEPVK